MKYSKKWKKCLEISSFYTSEPKTHDHMLYCSWDMVCDEYNCYFKFLVVFCPNSPKKTFQKNEKKCLEISLLYTTVPTIMIISYNIPDMVWLMWLLFSISGYFLPPNSMKNEKWKKWKKAWRYYPFIYVSQKLWLDDLRFLRYYRHDRRKDRKMDGQKKSDIEVGAPPKKA